jgi:hypothetical protein
VSLPSEWLQVHTWFSLISSSHLVFSVVCVLWSLVFCLIFCRSLLVLLSIFFSLSVLWFTMKWFRGFLCHCQLSEWVSDYCLMPNEPLFSYIMWEQVTICQLHVYHVRTSYNLSATCISKCISMESSLLNLHHWTTFWPNLPWRTVPLLIFATINRNKDSMWFINIWLQSSTMRGYLVLFAMLIW